MSKKSSWEVEFLHQERDAILQAWRDRLESSVNSRFFVEGSGFSPAVLNQVFDEIVNAVDKNLYRNLNLIFDTLVKDGRGPALPITNIREFMFQFVPAARSVLETRRGAGEKGASDVIFKRFRMIEHDLREVYSERMARNLLQVMDHQRQHVIDRWAEELPTPIISDHFSVLDQADRRAFLESTYDMYLCLLRGEDQDPAPAQGDQPARTKLQDYLFRVVEYYEPKGFQISHMQRALAYPLRILEPYLYRKLHHSVSEYRVAVMSLLDVIQELVQAFSEAYSERQLKNYYNEVSIMLHRIKNKLTPVLTTAETILMLPKDDAANEDDEVMMVGDPLILTTPEAEVLNGWFEKVDGLLEQLDKAMTGGGASSAALSGLEAGWQDYASFVQEQQQLLSNIRMKLDVGSVEMDNELVHMIYESGKLTNQLAMELQLRQNELYQREPPRRTEIDIYQVVRDAFNDSITEARSREQEYSLDAEDLGVYVFGVEKELKRPFIQVIENALKYTPRGGAIQVRLAYEPQHVVFSVKDNGIGIPKGEEEYVFGLCDRCSNAIEFNKVGTGTGLYNDRKTIMQHNGQMWVESEGVGTGSTFYIRLPIHRGAGGSAGIGGCATPAPPSAPASGHGTLASPPGQP